MNTLSKNITSQFFPTATDFHNLEVCWCNLINSERKTQLRAVHYLLYQILRGKDWRKAFTPITNQRKLANGAFYDWGLWLALKDFHYEPATILLAPFAGSITPEMLQAARQFVPYSNQLFSYGSAAFAERNFPCDAYPLPVNQLSVVRQG